VKLKRRSEGYIPVPYLLADIEDKFDNIVPESNLASFILDM
jgi:hypothetical protein